MPPLADVAPGDTLIAQEDLHQVSGHSRFTLGKAYRVLRIARRQLPPALVVVDDAGLETVIGPDFAHNFVPVRSERMSKPPYSSIYKYD